jgi:hypothetical protein
VSGGYRRAHIHLRTGTTWFDEPSYDDVVNFIKNFGGRQTQPKFRDRSLIEILAEQESIRLVAAKVDQDHVKVFHRDQYATIERKNDGKGKTYRYLPEKGDPLEYLSLAQTRSLTDGKFHDGRAWLEASCSSEFPDFVPQIVEMFDSSRAGQIVVFADRGWDFSRFDLGGHGSALKDDIRVPFVVVGPDIRVGEFGCARIVDILPTVLDLMGLSDRLERLGKIDGVSLMSELIAGGESQKSKTP